MNYVLPVQCVVPVQSVCPFGFPQSYIANLQTPGWFRLCLGARSTPSRVIPRKPPGRRARAEKPDLDRGCRHTHSDSQYKIPVPLSHTYVRIALRLLRSLEITGSSAGGSRGSVGDGAVSGLLISLVTELSIRKPKARFSVV